MTQNDGRLETMTLVSLALPCPPPPGPLYLSRPITTASKHNGESGGVSSRIIGWVVTGWTLPTSNTWITGLSARGDSGSVFFWLPEKNAFHSKRELLTKSPHLYWHFLSQWVCKHEWNLPRSAQEGPGSPLLVWDGPPLSEECACLPMVGEGDGQPLL